MPENDPDFWRFREYAEGHTNDSPVESDWRSAAPRREDCYRTIDEDEGCTHPDCLAERNEADA